MKNVLFLSCDDLTSYIVDDQLLLEENKDFNIETKSWSSELSPENYDAVVIRTTWDYTKNLDKFLSVLKNIESKTRLFNPYKVVSWNAKKNYLKKFNDKGIATVPSVFLEDSDYKNQIELKFGDTNKFVIKPVVGAGAGDIQVVTRENLFTALDKIQDKENWFVQPFIEDVQSLGEKSLIFFNGKLSHAVEKVPKKNDFRVQEEHGASIRSYIPGEKDLEFADQVLKVLEEKLLYTRIDVVSQNNQPMLMELELIEPSFYLRYSEQGAKNFLTALKHILE